MHCLVLVSPIKETWLLYVIKAYILVGSNPTYSTNSGIINMEFENLYYVSGFLVSFVLYIGHLERRSNFFKKLKESLLVEIPKENNPLEIPPKLPESPSPLIGVKEFVKTTPYAEWDNSGDKNLKDIFSFCRDNVEKVYKYKDKYYIIKKDTPHRFAIVYCNLQGRSLNITTFLIIEYFNGSYHSFGSATKKDKDSFLSSSVDLSNYLSFINKVSNHYQSNLGIGYYRSYVQSVNNSQSFFDYCTRESVFSNHLNSQMLMEVVEKYLEEGNIIFYEK